MDCLACRNTGVKVEPGGNGYRVTFCTCERGAVAEVALWWRVCYPPGVGARSRSQAGVELFDETFSRGDGRRAFVADAIAQLKARER